MSPRKASGLVPAISDAPESAVGVVRHKESAVTGDRHADGSAPNATVVDDESDQEILIFSRRHAVLQSHANHLAPGAPRPVP
jgi:hypothetical protein